MDGRVVKFLKRHRIGCITTLLKGNQPHSATVHIAFNESPFYFVIWTGSKSRKLSGLKKGENQKSSLVLGFSEEEWITMQLEGEVKWVTDEKELKEIWKPYTEKFNDGDTYPDSPESALIKFTPTWWRYSEVKPEPALIITSED